MNEFLPFIVIGITTGSVYGLAAAGLVLSYKTSGIFNFAFGAIAALAVFAFYWLHTEHGMAWPLAAVLSVLVLGPIVGLLLELLARRLQSVDHTLQIAATVGLALWIVGIGGVWFTNVSGSFPPFLPTSTVEVAGVNIEWQQIIVVAVSLVASIGLHFFLRHVRLGKSMRAVVDDPALVSLHGDNPARANRWAWVISSTFAAAAGLLIAPELPLEATVLTLLVVQAFGAAAIGYFSSLPLVYVGGLLLGIAGALATKYVNSVSWLINLPSGLPFIILIVVLVALPKSRLTLRRFTVPVSLPPSWQAPLRFRLLAGLIFIGVLCAVPSLVGTDISVYSDALTLAILLLSLGLLVRTSRQVSLCQYAFAAIGAAAMAHFTSGFGLPWLLALLLAGLAAVPIGALVAIPAIRLSGVFLALATLGFGILLEQVFYDQSFMFGSTGNGISTPRPDFNVGPFHASSDVGYYFVIVICAVILTVLISVVTATRLGRMLRAMGDSPLALESCGLSVNVTRVLVFCLSAFVAAVSGALASGLFGYALGSNFPSFNSLTLIALVVVVVVGDPWYAVIGAAALTIIPIYLTSGNVGNYLTAIFGIGAFLVPAFRDKLKGTPEPIRRWAEQFARGSRPAVAAAGAVGGTGPATADTGADAAAATTPGTTRRPKPAAPASGEGLVVERLSVRFGGTLAVNNVSLRAPLGSITGLIGPNGAGKTTTFSACSGLVKPDSGKISLLGRDISGMSTAARARRGLGRTFQRVQLFESLSVRTNIELARECDVAGANPYRHLISSRREGRAVRHALAEAVELAGVGEFLDAQVHELSTGQRRLVELARVLAGDFRVVLLDEPSSGLDNNETERFGQVLLRVVEELGVGLLLIEHDMTLVRQVCSRIFVLDFGNLVFEGSPAEMLHSNLVKAAYLGTEGDDTDPISTTA